MMSSYSWRLKGLGVKRLELKDGVGMNYLAVNSSLTGWQDSGEYPQGVVKARRNLLPSASQSWREEPKHLWSLNSP